MGDEYQRAAVAIEERLEPLEAVVIEVVRRLVEQKQVEAGEEDRRERNAGGLSAGERRAVPLQVDLEPEIRADAPRPRPEVAAADSEERVQGVRVAVVRRLSTREGRRRVLELALGGAHTRSSCERIENGLPARSGAPAPDTRA